MKRRVELHPLSREHHHALVLARTCERAVDPESEAKARADWERTWSGLRIHFDLEELHLGPLCSPEERRELEAQHAGLRSWEQHLEAGGSWRELGERLRAHVRWEERILFPAIEEREPEEWGGPGWLDGLSGLSCALPGS